MPISRLSLASELLLYQPHSALPDKTLPIIAPLRRFLRPGLNSPLLIFNYWRRRPARLHVCTPFSVLLSRKKSLHLTTKKASPHEKKGLRSREKTYHYGSAYSESRLLSKNMRPQAPRMVCSRPLGCLQRARLSLARAA